MVKAEARGWTFLTNHTHVLLSIAQNPEIRLREIAEKVGITERSVQRIVAELKDGGYLDHERVGHRNHYRSVPNCRCDIHWRTTLKSMPSSMS